jgi:signal transduction histidine kinase
MKFIKNKIPEFWHHQERVAGEKGQQYIFRNKWLLLIQATFGLTLVPLALSTFFFYENNKTETITDLLSETSVLASGGSLDVEIYFDKYLSTLRIIRSQFPAERFKDKKFLNSIIKSTKESNIHFSSLNIVGKKGCRFSCCDNNRHDCNQIDLYKINWAKEFFIDHTITKAGKLHLIVGLKLNEKGGDPLFLVGVIENFSTDQFLAKLKLKDIVDIFIMDKNGSLLTPSVYFGRPGQAINFPKSMHLPLSKVLPNPDEYKKGGEFLFYGISKIGKSDMNLGILLSNHNYEVFMARIRSHILLMVSLSALFAFIAVFVLVTWIIGVLYKADKIRQIYLIKASRSSKMASIGQLAAGVAHEINNPLAIINEKAGLLHDFFSFLEEYQGDERLLPIVNSITTAVERAGTITHRLLGFARETDSSVQQINIKNTIQEVLGFINKEAEYKSININVHIHPFLPEIVTDNGKLQQILINLVNNAISAMDEKGELTLRAKNNVRDDSVEIIVQDNGCGISTKHQKKIFEPFFTTKSEIGGTGLGLSLTYGLTRDLHGTLEFESSAGVGTTFTITLPYTINEEE